MSSIIKNRNLNFEPEDVVKVSISRNMTSGSSALAVDNNEDDFSKKLDNLLGSINEAQIELETLAKQKEELIEEANSQAQAIREEALREGSELGYNEGKEKINVEFAQMKINLQNEMENERAKFEEEKKEFYKEFKDKVGMIITDAVSKLFEHEVKSDKNILDSIILKGLMELSDEKDIRIVLSDEDYKNFDKDSFVAKLKDAGYEKEIAITYDKNLQMGDCLIDTNAGFISCGVHDFANCLSLLVEKNITY